MIFGYGDILDYLMSIHRGDLNMAMKFDSGYIILKGATPAERAMMVLDSILNYGKTELVRYVLFYAGSDVLSSRICGIPLVEFAKRAGVQEIIETFTGKTVTSEEMIDESALARVTEMFKVKLNDEPDDPMANLMRGLNFIQRECLSGDFDGFGPKK